MAPPAAGYRATLVRMALADAVRRPRRLALLAAGIAVAGAATFAALAVEAAIGRSLDRSLARLGADALVLPASVSSMPGRATASTSSRIPEIDPTPVATTTRSAVATAVARSVAASSMAWRRFASASEAAERPTPITRPASFLALRASPIEPPIMPTPTITTVDQ